MTLPSPPRRLTKDSEATMTKNPTPNRNTLRWWIVSCIAFLCLAPLVSIMLGLRLHARNFQYNQPVSNFVGRTVLMELILINADPMNGVMTMDWNFTGEDQSDCRANNLQACSDINIFFDKRVSNLLRTEDPTELRTSDPPTKPIFRINATAFATDDIISNTPTFRTQLALFSISTHESALMYYPFDQYSAEIFIFARDARNDEPLGIRIAKTRGIATGFKTMATTSDAYIPLGMINFTITLQRGNLVKAFSLVTVLAIWLITLILLLVMLTCVFFGFRQRGEVLVIPVATLFAFTQLRRSMPGAPEGFGDILDFVGLLPCLTLLSLSAALTLGVFILSDPTEKSQVLSWDMFFEAFPMLDPSKVQAARTRDMASM